jgi:hypothetical protein
LFKGRIVSNSQENTKISFETSFECLFKPLKHICEFRPWNGHIRHLHRRFKSWKGWYLEHKICLWLWHNCPT